MTSERPVANALMGLAAICAATGDSMERVVPCLVHDELRIYISCSDLFEWGTADAERFELDDIPLLYECLNALRGCSEGADAFLFDLFCCRKRGLPPFTGGYPPDVLRLFPEEAS